MHSIYHAVNTKHRNNKIYHQNSIEELDTEVNTNLFREVFTKNACMHSIYHAVNKKHRNNKIYHQNSIEELDIEVKTNLFREVFTQKKLDICHTCL